jgi:hypothetical protein
MVAAPFSPVKICTDVSDVLAASIIRALKKEATCKTSTNYQTIRRYNPEGSQPSSYSLP